MDELGTLDAELLALAEQQRGGTREAPLPAQFSIEPIYSEEKSKAAGRPVYADIEIIEIRVGKDIIRRQVSDADRRTYAAQYLAFRKGESQEAVEGMPLSQWAAMPSKSLVKEFAHYGIRSVEQLAAASDSALQNVGPHLSLRAKARDWLADAQKQAPLAKLREENETLKARLTTLEGMLQRQGSEIEAARQNGGALPMAAPAMPDIAALVAQQVAAAMAAAQPAPKKRGRPPKAQNGAAE